jgi:hypothetical protein
VVAATVTHNVITMLTTIIIAHTPFILNAAMGIVKWFAQLKTTAVKRAFLGILAFLGCARSAPGAVSLSIRIPDEHPGSDRRVLPYLHRFARHLFPLLERAEDSDHPSERPLRSIGGAGLIAA